MSEGTVTVTVNYDVDDIYKICTGCGENKPLDAYGRQAAGKYGRNPRCKACRAAAYAANPEPTKAAAAARAAADPERHRADALAWYNANKERAKARFRADYAANAEQRRAYAVAWRAANREAHRASANAWHAANPDKARASVNARRARVLNAQVDGPVSAAVYAAIMASGPCVYCGAHAEHVDHVRPLFRGGWEHESNLVPACSSCNSSKHARLLTEWDPIRVAHAATVSEKVAAELARLQAKVP